MIHRPKAEPTPIRAPESRPEPVTHKAPDVHVHAPVTVHTDNRATVEALQQQAEAMSQLQGTLAALADKMTPGVLTVTITEWTPMGRIKAIQIKRG